MNRRARAAAGNPAPAGDPAPDSLMALVLDVADQLNDRLEQALARQGLSWAKAVALENLAEADDTLTLGELAAENACVRSNITQLVDRLEAGGLVRRVNDPQDRRVRRVALTSEGRKAHHQAAKVFSAQQRAVAAALSAADARLLARLLRRLVDRH